MKKIIILSILIVLIPSIVFAEELKFSYGFEDWTGDAATTPNYFSSTSYSTYWDTHILATEVVQSGDENCNFREAQEGDYYYHQNFFSGGQDDCLGTTPIGIYPHTNIGINLKNPPDPKSNFNLATDILTGEMLIRFYFRTTGDWPNAVTNFMKFIRVYGDGVSSAIFHISDDGTTFDFTDHPYPDNEDPSWGDYHNIFTAPINWNDGEWHSISLTIEILNNNEAPNIAMSAWWDDWDMVGEADGFANVYHSGYGDDFSHISLFVNWGATYPDTSMGLDMDNMEIWDGLPSQTICSDYNNNQTDCETNDCIYCTENNTCGSVECCSDDAIQCTNQTDCEMTGWNWCESACQSEICEVNIIRADVNQDLQINTTDAMLALRNSLDLDMTETAWQISATTGDVSCDDNSNSIDAMLLLRYSLGLDMSETDWCE